MSCSAQKKGIQINTIVRSERPGKNLWEANTVGNEKQKLNFEKLRILDEIKSKK